MDTVRLLIADDHEFAREGLTRVLAERHPEWEIVGAAADGREALEMAERLRPDVAILDLSMPYLNGLEVTERLVQSVPGIRIVVLTVHAAEPVMRQIRSAGAKGLLAKNEAPKKLVDAVERALAGATFVTSESSSRAPSELKDTDRVPAQFLLTPREIEVLKQLVRGLSNKEIAGALDSSVRTIETHRANIMARLSVDSLGELVKLAILDGLVDR
ncbi:MAG TPA: response regulator transcription factor [Bryobacteraceae bacterium]|nr:response regulator transcription factor [Bryobacteraceae bacterium]